MVWKEGNKISPTAQCTCSRISTPSQTLTKDILNSIVYHYAYMPMQYLNKDYRM